MSVPRRYGFPLTLLVLVILSGSVSWRWHATAQRNAIAQPVIPANAPTKPVITDGDRGPTYHALERHARHVVTTFDDAVVESDRTVDGSLRTRVNDVAGNERAAFIVESDDAIHDKLDFATTGGSHLKAARRPSLRPTLHWSAEQAYSLWQDRKGRKGVVAEADDDRLLEWQDSLMRPVGAARRDVKTAITKLETVYDDGGSTSVTHKIGTHESYLTGARVSGLVYTSVFYKDGQEMGFSQWWPAERAFAWRFTGLTEGYITEARLRSGKYDGWSFAPDMAWLSVQNYAFYTMATTLKAKGTVAANRSPLMRFVQWIAPTVSANDVGCDGLHWLDSTIFRPCCDEHDRCYYTSAQYCGQSSWWSWGSWNCFDCNVQVFACFITGGAGHVLYRSQ